MYVIDNQDRACQGDLYRDFLFLEYEDGSLELKTSPFVFVLSQECDLKWDYEAHNGVKIKYNQFINSILCIPAYHSSDVMLGTHMGENYNMQDFGKPDGTPWKHVIQNSNPRYHFLRSQKVDEIKFPELVIDFKHYYSIPRDLFYSYKEKAEYMGRLDIPFRELVSQRFAYFVSRIGEPEPKDGEIDCDLDPCHSES